MVVFTGGFEINPFMSPAHRPVQAPRELGIGSGAKVYGLCLTGFVIPVSNTPLSVPIEDCSGILVSKRGEYRNWPPILFKWGCTEFIQYATNLIFLFQGCAYALGIFTIAITLRLVEVLRLHSHYWEYFLNVDLIGVGVVIRPTAGVGYKSNGFSQESFQQLGLRHVFGNFPEHIVIIPTVDESDVFPFGSKCLHHKVYRDDLSEVPYMDCSRRGNA